MKADSRHSKASLSREQNALSAGPACFFLGFLGLYEYAFFIRPASVHAACSVIAAPMLTRQAAMFRSGAGTL
jgi:hypothetical protein